VPYVVGRLRVLALATIAVLIPLTFVQGADARTKYKPRVTSSDAGGASIDRYYSLGSRALRPGAEGHDVRVLQDYLRRAGFRVARIDGVFGRATRRVVRKFERANGLKVNGRLSHKDIRFLRGFVERGQTVTRVRGIRAFAATANEAGLNSDGTAVPPANAPEAVKQIIEAGNRIATRPYVYGGGHGKWEDRGYDCSGSVSYALHGAGLLKQAMPSGGFMKWGDKGAGDWVTIYAHGGHIYMTVAGLRFDTSGRSDTGSRWQASMRSPKGYTIRHPAGL
jgi:Putative peptidoglycan binding domain